MKAERIKLFIKSLAICLFVICFFGLSAEAQIGQTRDSVLLVAKERHWQLTDSSDNKLQFFGDNVNYGYYFDGSRVNYNLVIANKIEAAKIKVFLKELGFTFLSANKTTDYAYINEKMKAQATLEYQGKSIIVKIFPRVDFAEFHLGADDTSKVVPPPAEIEK